MTFLIARSFSKTALISIILVLLFLRAIYFNFNENGPKVICADAFGYYIYLPAIFIYQDVKELGWVPGIESQYQVQGGDLYQARLQKNGKFVFKYYGGLALLQLPFFLVADSYARLSEQPRDGFSLPYQCAVILASLFYSILGLWFLMLVLLKYYSDKVVALVLLLITLASNFPQYISIDSGQSHSYLFGLYGVLIYSTKKWHDHPAMLSAILTGLVSGLLIACRPTEAIAVFIPLLWGMQTKNATKVKWILVKANKRQIFTAVLFGILALMPQFIYWQYTTGFFIHDVGSKWTFLNPFFRVLFGWEKGWFIYTPVSILFVLSLFFIRAKEFHKSVLIFCLLNIWIIISWYEWRYGGSYSTRALVQCYPVFALSLGALITWILDRRIAWLFYVLAAHLIGVNLFQIYQYNKGILHYDDMNKKYYQRIYLNPSPSALDFSLMDTQDWVVDKRIITRRVERVFYNVHLSWQANERKLIYVSDSINYNSSSYLMHNLILNTQRGFWNNHISIELFQNQISLKEQNIRLDRPNAKPNMRSAYEFFTEIPKECNPCRLELGFKAKEVTQIQLLYYDLEYLK